MKEHDLIVTMSDILDYVQRKITLESREIEFPLNPLTLNLKEEYLRMKKQ